MDVYPDFNDLMESFENFNKSTEKPSEDKGDLVLKDIHNTLNQIDMKIQNFMKTKHLTLLPEKLAIPVEFILPEKDSMAASTPPKPRASRKRRKYVDAEVQTDDFEEPPTKQRRALYIIRNFLRGLLPGFEVIVDRWPEWQCVVLRPISEDKVLPYFHNTYICHTKSTSALKYFVQRPGVVDWSASVTFTGVPTSLVQVLNEKCRKNFRTITSADPRFMYAWSKKTAPEVPELPDGFSLSTLKPEHVPQMCKDFRPWKTGQDTKELEDYFSRVIGHFDNSCILDEEGELVAYISMQFNCSMTMLNVRPRYRGNDFGTIVLCALAQKLFIKGDIPYGFLTLKDNFLINYAQKLGFVWVPQGDMTWVHYSPKTEFQKSTRDVEKKEKRKHSSTDHNEEFYINAFPLAVQT